MLRADDMLCHDSKEWVNVTLRYNRARKLRLIAREQHRLKRSKCSGKDLMSTTKQNTQTRVKKTFNLR